MQWLLKKLVTLEITALKLSPQRENTHKPFSVTATELTSYKPFFFYIVTVEQQSEPHYKSVGREERK